MCMRENRAAHLLHLVEIRLYLITGWHIRKIFHGEGSIGYLILLNFLLNNMQRLDLEQQHSTP